jgi:hypothetical protein
VILNKTADSTKLKLQSTGIFLLGRVIAQAVSRWLPTAVARVRSRVWSSGICGGRSGAGAGFLRVLRFPPPIFIPPNSPSSLPPGAGAEWTQYGPHPQLCEPFLS